MADLWMPGALRADVGDHAPTDQQYPAKAIAHITWDKNATAAAPKDLVPFANLKNYFTGAGINMAPHILWDPFGGRIAQFYPANSRSKSVVDLSGGTRTNRAGKVVIQIEALFFPYCRTPDGKVYASLAETPCKGWAELNAWVRSWGVLDTWPMGHPVNFEPHRDEHTWETRGGWYGHNQVPENTHTDPGSWPAFVNTPKPKYEPYPGAGFFMMGRRSPIVAAMHDRLVAVGCNRYQSSANKNVIGSGDVASYEAWMREYNAAHHKGWSGAALKWPPGPETWDALKVPNV